MPQRKEEEYTERRNDENSYKRRKVSPSSTQRQIVQYLLVLGHCLRCHNSCQSENCRKMSELMEHRTICSVTNCVLCTRINKLYDYHRVICNRSDVCRICSATE